MLSIFGIIQYFYFSIRVNGDSSFFSLIRSPEVDLGIYFIYFQYYIMGGSGGCGGEGLNTISYNDLFLLFVFISILLLFLWSSFAFTSSP